jgi:hypothetical protein
LAGPDDYIGRKTGFFCRKKNGHRVDFSADYASRIDIIAIFGSAAGVATHPLKDRLGRLAAVSQQQVQDPRLA